VLDTELAIRLGIGAAMTAIECGRALWRLTAVSETSPTTRAQPGEPEAGSAAATADVDRVAGARIA
jgi:hypothetical protein